MPLSLNLSHQSWRPRRPSVPSTTSPSTASGHTPSFKSKSNVDSDPLGFGSRHGHNADLLGSKSSDSSPSATPYSSSSHSVSLHQGFQQYSATLPSRHRTSILSVASDALGFRKKIGSMSRKKQNSNSLPHSRIMPGVIEINALNNSTVTSSIAGTTTHKDDEHEERERLRDVAAQSIGLDPELLHASKSESVSLLDSPQSPPQPAPLPPFPATLVALHPFIDLSATLPKFTPPSSLLIYALAKQWKPRTIVLTSHSRGQKTHVHLFKGGSKDEKEIERLEVTEDSVIFVAEEVAGRGNVVKFAGKDVSSKQSVAIGEQNSRTMWFLQIKDPAESHRWIAAIKNAVLTQRAVRAGLDIPTQLDSGNEPKGDMDVMLSMRLQRISAHAVKTSNAVSPPSPLIPTSPSPPPSLRSLRINTSSPSPTAAIKGIFSGTRPRSPSVEGSPTLTYPPGHLEDSFKAAGTSLLTMLRSKSSTDSCFSPSHSLPLPLSHVPRQGSPAPSLRSTNAPVIITASDLKISKERDAPDISTSIPEASSSCTTPGSNTPPAPSFSSPGMSTFSLQPPPRKCKHAVTTTPTMCLHEPQRMYKQASGNRSVAGNFGIPSGISGDVTPKETPPVSPASSNFSGGHPGSFPPNSGLAMLSSVIVDAHVGEQSDEVMTGNLLGNGIVNCSSPVGSVPTDKLLQSTAITKRWSRQGVPLPKQLTPPSGPPPSVPSSPENNHRTSVESGFSLPASYAIDRSSSSSSSNFHSRARTSPRSATSLSPTFWKRASGSSVQSASSTSTVDSQGRSQVHMPFGGESFPSSWGSIVGNGGSSRPMSLSVHGSSPVVHIGTGKRRSMPPPRPAPNFAPPPAPTVQESTPGPAPLTIPASVPQKSFRNSVAQRAMRLSLTSPKPPPSSALPPRPDEATFVPGHRKSSSSGTQEIHPISEPSSRPISPHLGHANSIQRTSPPPRSLSIRQRLRILSTPPVQSSSSLAPSIQVSTLDLSDDNDNDDDPPTPHFPSPQPFGLGEHIMTIQNDTSFLQLSSPVTPTIPKVPPRSPFRPLSPPSDTMNGLRTPSLEADCDFVALSPPPPRRGSRPHVSIVTRPEMEQSAAQREESKLVALSQRGSVVSLGFVTT